MLKKFWIFIFALLLLYGNFMQKLYADSPATPDPAILRFPSLLINEVSFKNTESDWIELFIMDDGNQGNGNSIKGLKIQDDSVFLEIEEDIEIKSGDFVIVNFKSANENYEYKSGLLEFDITKKGLTGTTEQIIIMNNNDDIIDAVCWANSTPAQSELGDFEELINNGGWNHSEISNCVQSEPVENKHSIARTSFFDTNSRKDWTIFTQPTPGKENIIEIEPDEQNLNTVPEETETKTEIEIDTDCYSFIYINEILPNPAGTDSKSEWIELVNKGKKECNLYEWTIDDQEGGSKPYKINNNETVIANGFLLLPSWKTKINLNNSEDSVRLFSPDEKIRDEIVYENAKEQQSFSKTKENKFEWTPNCTPLTENIIIEIEEDEIKEGINEKSSKKNSNKNEVNIKNGDLSNNIFITELFPNPESTDKGKEWTEISNYSNKNVNLGNWKIKTDSSKEFVFPNRIIEADNSIILSDKELGFLLKNSENTLNLYDFENTLIDNVGYSGVKENQSYMKIKLIDGDKELYEWRWIKEPTPGNENKTYYIFTGEILNFYESLSKINVNVSSNYINEEIEVIIIEGGDMFLNEIFKKGTKLKMILSKNYQNEWLLEEYEIISQSEKTENGNESLLYIILSSLPPLGFLGYFGIKKFGILKLLNH